MFLQLATELGGGVNAANAVLTAYRPSQLSEYLEASWSLDRHPLRDLASGVPAPGPHQAMGRPASGLLDPLPPAQSAPPLPTVPVTWHHLVYAYMVENTRILDIFQRVVVEWFNGERLPNPTQLTQRWLQATEQLFFSPAWPYSVRAVTSSIRPDRSAVRRNAYYRMFGMDLNHGTEDGRPYPFIKSEVANREFATLFEALLVEVWRAFSNRTNLIGPRETDTAAIETLVRRLQEMLQARRFEGMLSREEFDAVSALAWFHLVVQFDTQIVRDLAAQAAGVADRLRRIGTLVGIPPHPRSDAYLQLAVPMSNVLLDIESGVVAQLGPDSLYEVGGAYTLDMVQIITQWSIATGRNIKDPSLRQPIGTVLQAAPSQALAVPSRNGGTASRIAPALR